MSATDTLAPSDELISAVIDAVRNEYGSVLCAWIDGGTQRTCAINVPPHKCRCRAVALAAIDVMNRRAPAQPSRPIQVDIGQALTLLQSSPELCAKLNELVAPEMGKQLNEAYAEIERLQAAAQPSQEAMETLSRDLAAEICLWIDARFVGDGGTSKEDTDAAQVQFVPWLERTLTATHAKAEAETYRRAVADGIDKISHLIVPDNTPERRAHNHSNRQCQIALAKLLPAPPTASAKAGSDEVR